MCKLGNIMILGDSYSTFTGHNPEGYAVWYRPTDEMPTDVRKVEETWWYDIVNGDGANLVINSSYSGTTICHTGYSGTDCINISFLGRFLRRVKEGFFEKNSIDTLFIFGGTNDTWANSPLGEAKRENWSTEDLYKVLPAISCLFYNVKKALPKTRVIFIANNVLKPEIYEELIESARIFGVEYLPLSGIDKNEGHPTIKGMLQIKEQVFAYLNK